MTGRRSGLRALAAQPAIKTANSIDLLRGWDYCARCSSGRVRRQGDLLISSERWLSGSRPSSPGQGSASTSECCVTLTDDGRLHYRRLYDGHQADRLGAQLTGEVFKLYGEHFGDGTLPLAVDGDSPQPEPKYPVGFDHPKVRAGSATYPLDVIASLSEGQRTLHPRRLFGLCEVEVERGGEPRSRKHPYKQSVGAQTASLTHHSRLRPRLRGCFCADCRICQAPLAVRRRDTGAHRLSCCRNPGSHSHSWPEKSTCALAGRCSGRHWS